MKRVILPILVGLIAGIVSALAGPILTVGRLPYCDIALFGAFFVGIPLAAISLILLAIPQFRSRMLPGIGLGVSVYLAVLLTGGGTADRLKRNRCHEAKAFCQSLIPLLEEYKNTHGAYPPKITDMIPPTTKLPMYLRRQEFYYSDSNDFSFGWVDSPGIPYCSGVAAYRHASTNWDFCADWGGIE